MTARDDHGKPHPIGALARRRSQAWDTEGRFHPESLLREGRFDSTAVLLLRCLRPTWMLLIIGGIVAVTISGDWDGTGVRFTSVRTVVNELLSPLVGIVLGVVLHKVVDWLGYAFAVPVADGHYMTLSVHRSRWRGWSDRVQLTRAYRTLRWTWAVQEVAVQRCGRLGRGLQLAERVIKTTVWVAAISAIPVSAIGIAVTR